MNVRKCMVIQFFICKWPLLNVRKCRVIQFFICKWPLLNVRKWRVIQFFICKWPLLNIRKCRVIQFLICKWPLQITFAPESRVPPYKNDTFQSGLKLIWTLIKIWQSTFSGDPDISFYIHDWLDLMNSEYIFVDFFKRMIILLPPYANKIIIFYGDPFLIEWIITNSWFQQQY